MGLIIQVAGVDLYNGILPSWPQSETTRGFATRRFRLGPVGKYSIIQVASGDLYKDNTVPVGTCRKPAVIYEGLFIKWD